jgi:hypothetical protein
MDGESLLFSETNGSGASYMDWMDKQTWDGTGTARVSCCTFSSMQRPRGGSFIYLFISLLPGK